MDFTTRMQDLPGSSRMAGMQSKAPTVTEYLASLPEERRKAIATVRSVIKKNLPKGYRETMQYGMITYVVPLERYPQGYLGKKDVPLPFVSLASQKNHMAAYLLHVYGDAQLKHWFQTAWKKSGKKLDMGKSCVRFKKVEDLALDVVGESVARMPVDRFIAFFEKARSDRKDSINANWHEHNVMPKNATLAQRISWHRAHQKNCACRPIPAKLLAQMGDASSTQRKRR
jgi:Domain of unknown function (DU1801)